MSNPAKIEDQLPPSDEALAAAAAASAMAAVPRWHLHRRLYDWVLSWAHSRHSTAALFMLSFAEASFFPVPPDVLQIALTLERRARAWFYATVSAVASVFGGVLGYAIGWGIWETASGFFFRYVPGFSQDKFDLVERWYDQWGVWVLFAAAFTPIPFKIFTIAGGVFHQPLLLFVPVSLIGRGLRFFIVAALLYYFGAPMKTFIEKYFNLLSLLFVFLLIGGFAVIKAMG